MRTILAASGVVIDKNDRLLLVVRTKDPETGSWTVPGGCVEPGETFEHAAAREVLEETASSSRLSTNFGRSHSPQARTRCTRFTTSWPYRPAAP
ncbi:NUDIX hydrolase [Microbacterium sp. 22303]|uniref:NUDIX hydrolase n=1 Tax=Microbacterium sp. 22303 TaxID=3453905 RepID=UPI003F83F96D